MVYLKKTLELIGALVIYAVISGLLIGAVVLLISNPSLFFVILIIIAFALIYSVDIN